MIYGIHLLSFAKESCSNAIKFHIMVSKLSSIYKDRISKTSLSKLMFITHLTPASQSLVTDGGILKLVSSMLSTGDLRGTTKYKFKKSTNCFSIIDEVQESSYLCTNPYYKNTYASCIKEMEASSSIRSNIWRKGFDFQT